MKRAEEENVMVYAIGLASSDSFAGGGHHSYPGGREDVVVGEGMEDSVEDAGGLRWPPVRGRDRSPTRGLPKIAAATGGG